LWRKYTLCLVVKHHLKINFPCKIYYSVRHPCVVVNNLKLKKLNLDPNFAYSIISSVFLKFSPQWRGMSSRINDGKKKPLQIIFDWEKERTEIKAKAKKMTQT